MHPQPKANEEEGEKSEPLLEEKEGEEEGDEAPLPPPALVFLAVSVDASPHMAQAHGPATWPHLRHYWIDAHTIDELGACSFVVFMTWMPFTHEFPADFHADLFSARRFLFVVVILLALLVFPPISRGSFCAQSSRCGRARTGCSCRVSVHEYNSRRECSSIALGAR